MSQRYLHMVQTSTIFFSLILGSILLLGSPSHGLSGPEEEDDLLFTSNEPIEITISSDFEILLEDRGEDRSNHRGKLYYLTNDLDTVFRKVKLKTRGNFRRDPANCKYPPIRVKFGAEQERDSLFTGQSKLKLVIQCQIEKYVLLEYLAYRIYNIISVNSYKVRLAHITYVDNETKRIYSTKYGFFIESQDQLEKRLEAENCQKNIVQYFIERKEIITMALFQYMIGNDDWYVTSKHNITTLQKKDTEDFLAIPYDFDWSNLVDAEYTKPPGARISDLRERRVYRGLCMTKEEFTEQQLVFNEKKDDILSLVNDIPILSTKDRNRAKTYLKDFYTILNKSTSLSEIFTKDQCITEQHIGGTKKSLTN